MVSGSRVAWSLRRFVHSEVPILPAKNPSPPRYLTPLAHALSLAVVLPHALAGGLVLVEEMVVLRVVPAGAKLRLSFTFFLLGCFDAFLNGARGLTAFVAGRSAVLCIGGERGSEEGEDEEEVTGVEEHLQSFQVFCLRALLPLS